jgi:CheY-like chemotaxis protein
LSALRTKFLLADDDTDDATLFCEALTMIAPVMECFTAESGRDLFALLAERHPEKPDIIFLDINIPVMNGWECLRKLKESEDYRDIPVIMYSTSAAKRDVQMAYSLGAMVFLTKPEDFSELCGILEVVATNALDSMMKNLRGFASVRFA